MVVTILVLVSAVSGILWLYRGRLLHEAERLFSRLRGASRLGSEYLSGNYAPVSSELLEGGLHVEGCLPAALDGIYVRNGPNPFFPPISGYHWFDGDGMLHAVRIKGGKASYSNAYVKTAKLQAERRAGYPLAVKLGSLEGLPGLVVFALHKLRKALGIVNEKDGSGTANTHVVFHAKQLLALQEQDMPYVVRAHQDAHIETIERQTYGGRLRQPFTAHPKIDPVTGILYGFGYRVMKRPYVHYFEIGAEGGVVRDFPVTIPDAVMMHDFAMTERHVIFLDLPLIARPESLAAGKPLYGFDKGRAARFGVLPKGAPDEGPIRWFELPAMYAFHVANAWEQGNTVRIFLSVWPDGYALNGGGLADTGAYALLTEVTLDLGTGEARQRQVADVRHEFPTVPAALLGRETRYAYVAAAGGHGGGSPLTGIAKLDMLAASPEAAVAARIDLGGACDVGEPRFVPRSASPAELQGEDDGYLLTYVYNSASDSSDFVVYDAKTLSPTPVARVRLPQRVPSGFHGTFLTEQQLMSQLPFDIHYQLD